MVSGGPGAGTRTPSASEGSGLHPGVCQPGCLALSSRFWDPGARGLLACPPEGAAGTLPAGARVPQAKRCRWPGDRSWPLSALVTRREGAALGGGEAESPGFQARSGHNQVMRDKGELGSSFERRRERKEWTIFGITEE